MQTTSSKVTSKGQIVIPKKIPEKYGIRPSSSIHWIEKEGGILMVRDSDDPIITARGMLKGSGLLKAYLLEKKKEKETEKKKQHMPNRYVLDSYALIGYLENEHFADRIKQLLKQAKKGEAGLYLHALFSGKFIT